MLTDSMQRYWCKFTQVRPLSPILLHHQAYTTAAEDRLNIHFQVAQCTPCQYCIGIESVSKLWLVSYSPLELSPLITICVARVQNSWCSVMCEASPGIPIIGTACQNYPTMSSIPACTMCLRIVRDCIVPPNHNCIGAMLQHSTLASSWLWLFMNSIQLHSHPSPLNQLTQKYKYITTQIQIHGNTNTSIHPPSPLSWYRYLAMLGPHISLFSCHH